MLLMLLPVAVSLENPENQISANIREAGNWMKLLISICVLWTQLPWSLSEYFDKWIINRIFIFIWCHYDIENWYHYDIVLNNALHYRYNIIMLEEDTI